MNSHSTAWHLPRPPIGSSVIPRIYLPKLMALNGYKPIADYGIIGDCRSAALVSRDGSIDWLCWPRFDSPSVFAALLDANKGGYWRVRARDVIDTRRSYVEGTNVLETEFRARGGRCVLTDCMVVSAPHEDRDLFHADHEILRRVECTEGEVEIESEFLARTGYATCRPRLRDRNAFGIEFDCNRGESWLRSTQRQDVRGCDAFSDFRLHAGETAWFSLSYNDESPGVIPPLGDLAQGRLDDTIAWWRAWSARCTYDGPWREQVLRSALALKSMIYAPSGAVIAAPTTSLPEIVGGPLNWDYRYCWLRDASLTTRALLGLGFRDEADAFIGWMLTTTDLTLPQLNVLYDVFGRQPGPERELHHLEGWGSSRPVRIGNAAADQLQLDVYGEVMDSVAQFIASGGELDGPSRRAVHGVARYVCENWNRPDHGIWEPRGTPRHHTHSRLLCWTALDRVLDLCEAQKLEKRDAALFRRVREEIRQQIVNRAWSPELRSYASTLRGHHMDASLLLFAWYGFEAADSERMQQTYQRIVARLRAGKNLLYRYRIDPPEGAFGICCFWEADYLALGGSSVEHASSFFEGLLEYANDLGLYAEEIDPHSGEALGNFPQAFTHVGMINAAITLNERLTGMESLAHRHQAIEAGRGHER